MEIIVSLVAFFALVASWFVLPATPPRAAAATSTATVPEPLATAA